MSFIVMFAVIFASFPSLVCFTTPRFCACGCVVTIIICVFFVFSTFFRLRQMNKRIYCFFFSALSWDLSSPFNICIFVDGVGRAYVYYRPCIMPHLYPPCMILIFLRVSMPPLINVFSCVGCTSSVFRLIVFLRLFEVAYSSFLTRVRWVGWWYPIMVNVSISEDAAKEQTACCVVEYSLAFDVTLYFGGHHNLNILINEYTVCDST